MCICIAGKARRGCVNICTEGLLEANLVVGCTCVLDTSILPGFSEWYLATSSLDMSQACLRYQIGTPTQDKPKEKIGTYCILRTNSLILDSYKICLPRARRAWTMCVRCPSIQHSYKPDISSGPSADGEDPPQNPQLTLQSRCTCSIYATSLDLRVILGVPDHHTPSYPL